MQWPADRHKEVVRLSAIRVLLRVRKLHGPKEQLASQQRLNIMQPWTDQFAGAPFAAQVRYDLLVRTFGLDSFKRKYLAELATLTRTLTLPARIARQIDELVPVIGPLVPQEPKDGRVISFDAAVNTGTFRRPFNQSSPDINDIKVFVPLRQASVQEQLKAQGVQ